MPAAVLGVAGRANKLDAIATAPLRIRRNNIGVLIGGVFIGARTRCGACLLATSVMLCALPEQAFTMPSWSHFAAA